MADVLIVGCGYVGSRLARDLREAHDVTAVTRTGVDIDGVADHTADVLDPSLDLPDADVLFYLLSAGGRSTEDYRRSFLDGLGNVLDAVDAVPVYASSTAVYGDRDGDWVDATTPVRPERERDEVQVAAEDVALGAGGVVVRFAGLYGPGRTPVRRYVGDRTVKAGYVNFLHRDDAASALAHAAFEGDRDLYVAVDDEPADRHEVARWIADRLGVEPADLVDEQRFPNKRLSNERLRREGWKPTYPSYRDGLDELLE